MDTYRHVFSLILISLCISKVTSLECYACSQQPGNKDKCIKTTKQCLEHEDICQSTISWQLPPYWVPYGDRMHVVSKSCSTTQRCHTARGASMEHCRRDWYNDWSCVECCTGDMCNYYVTLGAGSLQCHHWLTLLCASFVVLISRWL